MEHKPGEITRLLESYAGTDPPSPKLFAIIYDDLRAVASNLMRREGPGHLLQTTALVNETYVRLFAGNAVSPRNREHFFRIAARAMQRILIDEARVRKAQKRGGGATQIPLEHWMSVGGAPAETQLELQKGLGALGLLDARQAHILELHLLAGREKDEIASLLSLSVRTVEREIASGTLFLKRFLTDKK